LVKFIPKVFFFFFFFFFVCVAIMNGIVFLISFCACSLLVYNDICCFYILLLCQNCLSDLSVLGGVFRVF
jgi:hypothetical protein